MKGKAIEKNSARRSVANSFRLFMAMNQISLSVFTGLFPLSGHSEKEPAEYQSYDGGAANRHQFLTYSGQILAAGDNRPEGIISVGI